MADRPGLIGEADGSTLFLDEIGDLPEKLQVHLLRVLDQDGEYQRLGEARTRRSSFRLVAATNRPLSSLKHDLLARFVHRITVPTLDERREDVPLVLDALLRRAAQANAALRERFLAVRHGKIAEARVAPQLATRLLAHHYTHHMRELDRLLWLAIGTSEGEYLTLTPALEAELPERAPSLPQELDAERVTAALAQAGGNRTQAARILGLKNRFALLRLLKKFGLEGSEEGEDG
jgi:two-component system nitrogen regulation response regulator GlnG/two-component system response regulator HydG